MTSYTDTKLKNSLKFLLFLTINFLYVFCFYYLFYFISNSAQTRAQGYVSLLIVLGLNLPISFFVAYISKKFFKIQSYYWLFPFQSFISLLVSVALNGFEQKTALFEISLNGIAINPLIFVLLFYFVFEKIENSKKQKLLDANTENKEHNQDFFDKYSFADVKKSKVTFLTMLYIFLIASSFSVNLFYLPFKLFGILLNYFLLVRFSMTIFFKYFLSYSLFFSLDFIMCYFFFKKPIFDLIFKSKIMHGLRSVAFPNKESIIFAASKFHSFYIVMLIVSRVVFSLSFFHYIINDVLAKF